MIYLVHFEKPYPAGERYGKERSVQHYLGYTAEEDVSKRLQRHREGGGSPLLRAVSGKCIGYRVVRTWPGTRSAEHQMKSEKNLWRYCSVCSANRLTALGIKRTEMYKFALREGGKYGRYFPVLKETGGMPKSGYQLIRTPKGRVRVVGRINGNNRYSYNGNNRYS